MSCAIWSKVDGSSRFQDPSVFRIGHAESDRNMITTLNRLPRLPLVAVLVFLASIPSRSQASSPSPDGTKLGLGEYCYTITATQDGKEQPVGNTFQSIRREQVDGVDALAIVVHQHLSNGKFDLRDSFLLHRADLRPIRLDTDRNGSPYVHLDYTDSHVAGWKMVAGKKQPIDVTLDGPVWDGNLWGDLFAALHLQAGMAYQIPTYQYDSGKGFLFVNVVEPRKVGTPSGVVDAWALRAGPKKDELVDYLVGGQPRIELGYAAGPNSQHLGGECGTLH